MNQFLKVIKPFSIFILFVFASCELTEGIWVSIDPIQCSGNPWEQAWFEEHDVMDSLWATYTKDQKLDIFEQFYEDQGVEIKEIEVTYPYDAVCAACFCPRGDRIHCRIDEEDLDIMLDLGFVKD